MVAKGYSQVEGVDYDRTFSPTVRFESIRQMVALGGSKGLEMHQMDVFWHLVARTRFRPRIGYIDMIVPPPTAHRTALRTDCTDSCVTRHCRISVQLP